MPTVSRADCTQVDVIDEVTKFHYLDGDLKIEYSPEIEFNECEGVDDEDNELEFHYDLLVERGMATSQERSILSETLVGEDGCEDAILEFFDSR